MVLGVIVYVVAVAGELIDETCYSESVCKGESPHGKYHSILFLFFPPRSYFGSQGHYHHIVSFVYVWKRLRSSP